MASNRLAAIWMVPLLALFGWPTAAEAQVQPTTAIPVDVPWSGARPERVELRGTAPAIVMNLDAATDHFRGHYPRMSNIAAFDDVIMIGRWRNQDARLLFLRISPDMNAVNVHLMGQTYTECKQAHLDPLQLPARDPDLALEAYYRARALYTLEGDNQCRGDRKRSAARAWFDRSWELAMLNCLFRLSPDAAQAYRQYDPAYVASREEAARARQLGCRNEARNRLWSKGQFLAAYKVGQELAADLAGDPAMRSLASRYSAVREASFKEEQGQLGYFLATSNRLTPDDLAGDRSEWTTSVMAETEETSSETTDPDEAAADRPN